jgi:hypothetical protein
MTAGTLSHRYAAAYQDTLKGVHLVVGTPEHLAQFAAGTPLTSGLLSPEEEAKRAAICESFRLAHVRSVVIDEADACLAEGRAGAATEALASALASARERAGLPPPQTVLVGATLSNELVADAQRRGLLRSAAVVSERGWVGGERAVGREAGRQSPRGVAAEGLAEGLAAQTVPAVQGRFREGSGKVQGLAAQTVPAGSHEYVLTTGGEQLAVLSRLLRAQVRDRGLLSISASFT